MKFSPKKWVRIPFAENQNASYSICERWFFRRVVFHSGSQCRAPLPLSRCHSNLRASIIAPSQMRFDRDLESAHNRRVVKLGFQSANLIRQLPLTQACRVKCKPFYGVYSKFREWPSPATATRTEAKAARDFQPILQTGVAASGDGRTPKVAILDFANTP